MLGELRRWPEFRCTSLLLGCPVLIVEARLGRLWEGLPDRLRWFCGMLERDGEGCDRK